MTILLICAGLWFLTRLFSPVDEAERNREILLGIFISEYHKRSGIWVTREQAVGLIQLAYATIGNDGMQRQEFETQQTRAKNLALQVCVEAERAVLRKSL